MIEPARISRIKALIDLKIHGDINWAVKQFNPTDFTELSDSAEFFSTKSFIQILDISSCNCYINP